MERFATIGMSLGGKNWRGMKWCFYLFYSNLWMPTKIKELRMGNPSMKIT